MEGHIQAQCPEWLTKSSKQLLQIGEVQELRVAQEEARKLILANIKSEQQDRVESKPHWLRMWEAGDQVMLQADCRGKGWSKKLSKKWMGPYTIIGAKQQELVDCQH